MIGGLGKAFAYAASFGGPAKARLRLSEAYRRLFNGNGTKEDAEIVLVDLADRTGYFRRPSYAQWIASTKTPDGFELHSALCNARAEVVQHIMDQLAMADDEIVSLERAARLEGR